jgi:hypothetical protein
MRDDALVADEAEPAMDVVIPDSDEKLRAEGWRLHVYRQYADGNVYIASERVWPEKVSDPRAHRVFDSRRILLHPDEVKWLHERLGELLDPTKAGTP